MNREPSRRPVPVSVTVQSRLGVANDFLRMARYADVRRLASDVLAEQPNNWLALSLLARALSGLEEHTQAVATARRSVAAAPQSGDAHWACGWVLFRAGQTEEAKASFEQAVAIQPRHAPSHIMLGKSLYKLGSYTKGLAEIDAAIALEPKNADAWATRAMFLSYPSRSAESRAAAQEALRFAPNDARSHFAGGYSAMVSDDHRQAAEEFRAGLRLDPDNTSVKNAYVTVSKRLLPLYARIFGAPKWPNIMFIVAYLGFAADPIVSAGTIIAMLAIAALTKGETVESGFIIFGALCAVIFFHGWYYGLSAAFAALIVTLFLLGTAELITILVVSRERLVRNALNERHRHIAIWFLANILACAVFAAAGIWLRDGGVFWIAEACGTAAVLTAIYGRTFDHGNAALFMSSKAGIRVTVIGQIAFVLAGICIALTSSPEAANSTQPLRVMLAPAVVAVFMIPIFALTVINVFTLVVYLIALGGKALDDSNKRKKALRTTHV